MPFGPARRVLVMIRWPEVEPVLLTVYRLLDTEAPCGLLMDRRSLARHGPRVAPRAAHSGCIRSCVGMASDYCWGGVRRGDRLLAALATPWAQWSIEKRRRKMDARAKTH